MLASYGHVRDLPSKNGSVDTENKCNMTWEIDPGSKKPLKEIYDAAKGAKKIILATGPDREGGSNSLSMLKIFLMIKNC